MKPIPQNRLKEILTPIGESRMVEANMEDRANVDYSVEQVDHGYETRTAAAYVDDLDNPSSALIVRTASSWLSPGHFCHILLFWVKPEIRRTPKSAVLIEDMRRTYNAFAHINECREIVASSWVFLGSSEMDGIWSGDGFDLQEKVFVKSLTIET